MNRTLLTTLATLWLASPIEAHLLLSENVELYLDDPAILRLEFTIHAPELPLAVADGVDPAAVDETWLATLDDATLMELTREAEDFVRANFLVASGEESLLADATIEFAAPGDLRRPPEDTRLPPGCLLATVHLKNPGNPRPFRIGFAPGAQKRLLLSIARPASFPQVHDLAPGEETVIELPIPPAFAPPPPPSSEPPSPMPSEKKGTPGIPLGVIGGAAGLSLLLLLLLSRLRRSVQRRKSAEVRR